MGAAAVFLLRVSRTRVRQGGNQGQRSAIEGNERQGQIPGRIPLSRTSVSPPSYRQEQQQGMAAADATTLRATWISQSASRMKKAQTGSALTCFCVNEFERARTNSRDVRWPTRGSLRRTCNTAIALSSQAPMRALWQKRALISRATCAGHVLCRHAQDEVMCRTSVVWQTARRTRA
jgi:hypothetical protein